MHIIFISFQYLPIETYIGAVSDMNSVFLFELFYKGVENNVTKNLWYVIRNF